ncbi:hypothetical protein NC653_034052 [Populus alba x Populus x berolinensis]|uniref:Uncharacterized protein n=1 Tax=Populus alba x Populus x berolinensis TaxID=444605 RepID=A0AAD6LPG5_9ROSI|nr:hypothetical protein NC653_034052 [Populus alba x Populus x berolinensis]
MERTASMIMSFGTCTSKTIGSNMPISSLSRYLIYIILNLMYS